MPLPYETLNEWVDSINQLLDEYPFAGGTLEERTIENSWESGTPGDMAYDSTYLYVCIPDNTWRRISLGDEFGEKPRE